MRGIESQEYWRPTAATTAFSSMAIAFVLWRWYLDGAGGSAERHVRSQRRGRLGQIGFYLSVPVTFTFYVRKQIGNHLWHGIHYLS